MEAQEEDQGSMQEPGLGIEQYQWLHPALEWAKGVSSLSAPLQDVVHPSNVHSQMYIKGLDYDDRLLALAFVDVGMFVTSISVFKNLILFGDAFKSITFASLQVSSRVIVAARYHRSSN